MKTENATIKQARSLCMPWEVQYGYAQALKVGRSVWISGQLGHDEQGKLALGMEAQMQQTYVNIEKLLKTYGLSMENVLEETIYATDIGAAFQARAKLSSIVYPDALLVPSTLVQIEKLAVEGQLVEIKIFAKEIKSKKSKKIKADFKE